MKWKKKILNNNYKKGFLMKKEYYKICLRHMGKKDNTFLFWGENSSGYYRSIEDAGLYEESEFSFDEQLKHGDIYIEKSIVDNYQEEIILPKYGETQETYANRSSFNVLPNTGQIRKELGITTLDIRLDGNRNSFNAYFKDTCIEVFKEVYEEDLYIVKGKAEYYQEYWWFINTYKATDRNKAIYQAFKSGDFDTGTDSLIDFSKTITCKKSKTIIFDKWKDLSKY